MRMEFRIADRRRRPASRAGGSSLPWVGNHYASGINGQRLLVLGESHYSEDARNAYPQLTRDIVQQLVGTHARERPTETMWASGFEPLAAVLAEHQPSAVLVAGVGTWGGISRYFPADAQSRATASGEDVRVWKFAGQAPMVATWIDHPASFGFRTEEWTERVSRLFTEASHLTQPGHA